MMTKLGWDGGGHKITGLPEEIIDSAKITTTTGCATPLSQQHLNKFEEFLASSLRNLTYCECMPSHLC